MAEPTREQLLALMHANERTLCESKDAPAAQCEAIFDFYRRQWKENHPDPFPESDTDKRERTREGLEAFHALVPPPEKPKQLGQLLAELEQKDQPAGQSDSTEYDRRMAGMERDRDLFGDLVRSARERRHLRERKELLEREEQLQK